MKILILGDVMPTKDSNPLFATANVGELFSDGVRELFARNDECSVNVECVISDNELAEAMEKQMIAEREKRAAILRAEGISQAEILEAQGKAEAIRLVNESKPSQEFLTIRALEAYEVAAQGQATMIIVPSNLQSLAGLALTGSEVFKEGEKMGE